MKEKHQRSILKTITWRVLGTLITSVVVYIFTKKIVLSLSIGGLDATLKLLFYYLHERVWDKVQWGVKKLEIQVCKLNQKIRITSKPE